MAEPGLSGFPPAVSVIVPTRALAARAGLLREALRSILTQEGVRELPLVVINGAEADPALQAELLGDARLRVVVRPDADLPAALAAGRRLVDTAWFTALDDDDLLLPGALALRVAVLHEHPDRDVVVTNGFRRAGDGDALHVPDPAAVQRDPVRAQLRGNWLLPGSWLARSAAVGAELFDGIPRYAECTYLALRFATGYRMTFLATPTLVWRVGTPRSVSQSAEYLLGEAEALRRILRFPLPPEVSRAFQRHLAAALHNQAVWHLAQRRRRQAWGWHLRSLAIQGGWRYLPYGIRLLLGRR